MSNSIPVANIYSIGFRHYYLVESLPKIGNEFNGQKVTAIDDHTRYVLSKDKDVPRDYKYYHIVLSDRFGFLSAKFIAVKKRSRKK